MKQGIPKTVSVLVLSEFLGVAQTKIRERLRSLGMSSVGQVPFGKSARALTLPKKGEDTRDALKVIELENARIEQLKLSGELCLLSDAKLYWSDGRIAIRQMIESRDYLSDTAKRRLLTELAAHKQKPPEACA